MSRPMPRPPPVTTATLSLSRTELPLQSGLLHPERKTLKPSSRLGKARESESARIMLARNVHFIGIAGAGMSATAKLLRDSGCRVTGSDEGVYPPVSDFLMRESIAFQTSYAPENIPPDVEL